MAPSNRFRQVTWCLPDELYRNLVDTKTKALETYLKGKYDLSDQDFAIQMLELGLSTFESRYMPKPLIEVPTLALH